MASYSSSKVRINAPLDNSVYRRDTGPRHPSLDLSSVPCVSNAVLRTPQYDGEMLERERIAQTEIAHKKTCVAPLHKSGYIYVTPGISPGSFRKNEVL